MNRLLFIAAAGILAFLAFAHRPGTAQPAQLLATPAAPPGRTAARIAPPSIVVYVAGAVQRPGLARLAEGSRADDAVRRAGGFSQNADRAAINLAELLQDGEEVRVLHNGENAPAKRARSRSKKQRRHKSRMHTLQLGLDLNAASAAQLAQLPGVGYTLAERVVQYRQLNGRFASVDELADVSGFTPRRVEALGPYLRTGAPP